MRAEKQDNVKWLEDQRQQIVEAAREFAVQQEQTFTKKIQNLEEKLARKDEDLQEMESAVHQLQHDLRTVQQEKVSEIFGLSTYLAPSPFPQLGQRPSVSKLHVWLTFSYR